LRTDGRVGWHLNGGANPLKLRMLKITKISADQLLVEASSLASTNTPVPMATKQELTEHSMPVSNLCEERRRSQRLRLQVPLFVRGRDVHRDQFVELAKTLDISALGAFITCPRALSPNEIITLTIPAPSITSSALVPAGMPPIQARVKRQHEAGDVHLIGVEFLKPIG